MDGTDFFSDDSFQELEEQEAPVASGRQPVGSGSLKNDEKNTAPSDSIKSSREVAEERDHLKQECKKLTVKY